MCISDDAIEKSVTSPARTHAVIGTRDFNGGTPANLIMAILPQRMPARSYNVGEGASVPRHAPPKRGPRKAINTLFKVNLSRVLVFSPPRLYERIVRRGRSVSMRLLVGFLVLLAILFAAQSVHPACSMTD